MEEQQTIPEGCLVWATGLMSVLLAIGALFCSCFVSIGS
jgi:hypothetical protein